MKALTKTLSLFVCSLIVAAVAAKPISPPIAWPNLDNLKDYPTTGKQCALRGNAPSGTEKALSNALKNRYKLPSGMFEPLLLSDIFALPSGTASTPPDSHDPNNARAVSVVGYVRAVQPGGTHGESCNCKATGTNQVDTHIEIVLDPNNTDNKGHNMVVVEVTERGRRLATSGFLSSNIGKNWTTAMLQAKLKGRWVRFSGWLFYDPDHHDETWRSDPTDSRGAANWRETGWEIHPVMAIESGVAPPPDRVH